MSDAEIVLKTSLFAGLDVIRILRAQAPRHFTSAGIIEILGGQMPGNKAMAEALDSSVLYLDTLESRIETLEKENAALREAQRWIPVTERLPDPGERVLVRRINGSWDRGELAPLWFDGLPGWYLPDGPTMLEDAPHWSPPPEEQK